MDYGDIRLGDTIDVKFCTVTTTGAPTTLAGSPVISAYVGNGTTEITAGITLSVDFDSRTGMHNVRVVASGGNGFASATNVQLVLTAGTVGGTSVVGYVVGTFSIECRSALMPTTAARTLVVDAAGLADANAVKVGPTGSGTAQTAGDIMADTNDIQTRLPAALVSGRMDSSVGAIASNAITAASINASALNGKGDWNIGKTGYALSGAGVQAIWDALTSALTTAGSIGKLLVDNINATISSRLASASYTAPLDAAGTRSAVGLASANLDTQLTAIDDYIDTEVAAIKAKTDNLPAAPAAVGDIPTAAQNATALLDTANGVETSITPRQSLRLMLAALAGKLSGAATTTVTIRNVGDTKARITATVDADGNRSAVTTDAT